MGEPTLFWAMQNGSPKHVSEVPNGLACGCACPSCGATLMAKHGQKKAHHFAHYDKEACNYKGETAIHLAAKEIIKSRGCIVLPPPLFVGGEPKRYDFDFVVLEARYNDFIPDVLAEIDERVFIIEIAVTHFVDAAKKAKIAASGAFAAIEINLQHQRHLSRADLEKAVIESTIGKQWLYSAETEAIRAEKERLAQIAEAEKKRLDEVAQAEKERLDEERNNEFIKRMTDNTKPFNYKSFKDHW